MAWECGECGGRGQGPRPTTCALCGARATEPSSEELPEPGELRALWLELGVYADTDPLTAARPDGRVRL